MKITMADYHMQDLCREINLAAAGLAREMADEYGRASGSYDLRGRIDRSY